MENNILNKIIYGVGGTYNKPLPLSVLARVYSNEKVTDLNQVKQKAEFLYDNNKKRISGTVESFLKREDRPSLICEIKRSSPSKGFIATIAHPGGLASEYQNGGADAISCLTEKEYFGGDKETFFEVRDSVNIPVLQKDFIITPYQVYTAKILEADIILLIVAAFDKTLEDASGVTLKSMIDLAHSIGLSVLVETHNEQEISTAIEAGAKIIGINTRNLKTFDVDTNLFSGLIKNLPSDIIKVAESGVMSIETAKNYSKSGADSILIGEFVASADNPAKLIEEIRNNILY
jgi:tryptophan synthase beta chain